jgi:ribosome-binding protein aMBF1 (putative translation factor)
MTRKMNSKKSYNSQVIDDLLREISPEELSRTEKRMLLAVRIDESIKSKGWKKKDFAKSIKKKPSEISKWLSGTHNFTADTLFDIERVLNIHLFKFESKPDIVYKTYFFSATNITSESQQQNWLSIMNKKFSKSSYKAISSIT